MTELDEPTSSIGRASVLLEDLSSPNFQTRADAVYQLAEYMGIARVETALIGSLDDEDSAVGVCAVRALALEGGKFAFESILLTASRTDETYAQKIISALIELMFGGFELEEQLREAARNGSTAEVQDEARFLLDYFRMGRLAGEDQHHQGEANRK